jgi:predicted Zn-dependent protease
MALEDYLKSGWIAGLQPDTVKRGTTTASRWRRASRRPPQWNFRVAVVRYEGRVYRFIFAAKFDSPVRAAAEPRCKSFRATTDRDASQVRSSRSAPWWRAASTRPTRWPAAWPGSTRGTDLFYILNNLYPGDTLVAGQKYKIVAMQ